MSNTKSRRHIHKYYRVLLGATPVWACALPNCNHYMPEIMERMVPGKMSICHGCDEKFVLDTESMRPTHPMCMECRGIDKTNETVPLSSAMEEYLRGKIG
jgi:hypothetical protein